VPSPGRGAKSSAGYDYSGAAVWAAPPRDTIRPEADHHPYPLREHLR
jgi:hypothetical protein